MHTFAKTLLCFLFPSGNLLFERGLTKEFFLCLVLSLIPLASILYSFALQGVSQKNNLFCLFFPAYAVYSMTGFGRKFALAVVLSLLLHFPGAIYAYYESMKQVEETRAKPSDAEYSSIIN